MGGAGICLGGVVVSLLSVGRSKYSHLCGFIHVSRFK